MHCPFLYFKAEINGLIKTTKYAPFNCCIAKKKWNSGSGAPNYNVTRYCNSRQVVGRPQHKHGEMHSLHALYTNNWFVYLVYLDGSSCFCHVTIANTLQHRYKYKINNNASKRLWPQCFVYFYYHSEMKCTFPIWHVYRLVCVCPVECARFCRSLCLWAFPAVSMFYVFPPQWAFENYHQVHLLLVSAPS